MAVGGCYRDVCVDLPDRLAEDLEGAFEALVVAHQDLVFGVARRMLGDDHDAEEAAQDAFLRAHRALRGYPPERIRELRLRPWLARITLNVARNRVRAKRPVAIGLTAADAAPAPDGGPARTLERKEEAEMWTRLLAGLPMRYRLPLELRHVEGLSYPEVADALGRPVGTVKAQLHRGARLLRAAFEAEQAAGATVTQAWQRREGAA